MSGVNADNKPDTSIPDSKEPSIANGIEGCSGLRCLEALEETLRVAEGRVYSSALANLLQSPLAAALTETDADLSAGEAAKKKRAIQLLQSTTAFLEDSLSASTSASAHADEGAAAASKAHSMQKLNESIKSRLEDVARSAEDIGGTIAMYAAAFALEKKLESVTSGR